MAIKLTTAKSLTTLANQLCETLDAQHKDVFAADYLVVQTDGMASWLKQQIAKKLGIASNYKLLTPHEIVTQLYILFEGRDHKSSEIRNLTWLIFSLLNDDDFKNKYPGIAKYYAVDQYATKRFALAEKVADLFDQYQIYREEIILKWNASCLKDTNNTDWQQYLWLSVKATPNIGVVDKTMIKQIILQHLKNPNAKDLIGTRFNEIDFFGLSILSPYFIELYVALAKVIDLNFYMLNPSPKTYWFADDNAQIIKKFEELGLATAIDAERNSLLENWGKLSDDTLTLLLNNQEILANYHVEDEVAPVDPSTLLAQIQQEINQNIATKNRRPIADAQLADGSIAISNCYTVVREVESLYNYLVSLIDQKEEQLSPQDIVVLCTDIDSYAPYIKAVFNNAPYSLKYVIADESFDNEDSISHSFNLFLNLDENTFKAEAVLELLASSAIKKRFKINNVDLIRRAVDQANIRFGIHGDVEEETNFVSWTHGLNRIIIGLCVQGDDIVAIDKEEIYPVDLVEGHSAVDIVHFSYFCKVLIELIEYRREAKSLAVWSTYLSDVLNSLFDAGNDDQDEAAEELSMLVSQFEQLNTHHILVGEAISFQVIKCHFKNRIADNKATKRFASGGITFCSAIPMRSIPFKVIAMMGMNFDKFPRKDTLNSFSLIDTDKRKGDRSVKDNDKHLFLETFLVAQNYFYLSYIGLDCNDNSTKPPSALIDELLDYIATKSDSQKVKTQLVTNQPLHGYSRKFNKTDSKLINYLLTKNSLVADYLTGKRSDNKPKEQVFVHQLVNFFKNPAKAYFNNTLGIFFEGENLSLAETEIFDLDNLQSWALKNQLVHLTDSDLPNFRKRSTLTGLIPLKSFADIALADTVKDVSAVKEMFQSVTQPHEAQEVELDVELGNGLKLNGSVGGIYNDKHVTVCFSKNECKHLMTTYIKYLALQANGCNVTSCFISQQRNIKLNGLKLTQSEAKKRLSELVDLYVQGQKKPMCFYTEIEKDPTKILAIDSPERLQEILAKKVNQHLYGEQDPYVLNIFHQGYYGTVEGYQQYQDVAGKAMIPLIEFFEQ